MQWYRHADPSGASRPSVTLIIKVRSDSARRDAAPPNDSSLISMSVFTLRAENQNLLSISALVIFTEVTYELEQRVKRA